MSNREQSSELIRATETSGFARWQLPAFDEHALNVIQTAEAAGDEGGQAADPELSDAPSEDPVEVEDIAPEAVQPLTLEEVEAVRQDAYNEGFSTGEKDGFRAGQLRARQEAEAALAPRLQALESLLQQLFDPIGEQDQAIEHILLDLVCLISKEVIQRELTIDSSQIARVLRDAMKLLPMDDGQVRIHVNPQDFAAIKELRERHDEDWRILEDDSLLPGGCRVETRHSQIDASMETRLQSLTRQLLEQRHLLSSEPIPADLQQDFDLSSQALPPDPVTTDITDTGEDAPA